jgi:hypothetical protein
MNFSVPGLADAALQWGGDVSAVASDRDRWQPNGIDFYRGLNIETTVFPGAGHFSLDDGWGRWSGLEAWVESANSQDLMRR